MLKSGFFNSINKDRTYSSEDLNQMFSDIFTDGIFASYVNSFRVNAYSGMSLLISPGKAWLMDRWVLNTESELITIPASDLFLDRWDAVILEINISDAVRGPSLKIISGEPATTPVKPLPTTTSVSKQLVLCYILVKKNVTKILQTDITDTIGTPLTPYVTTSVTTDSANIYSTLEERIVGSFEGKPIYRKGFFKVLPSSTSSEVITHNIQNMGVVIKREAFWKYLDAGTDFDEFQVGNARLKIGVSNTNIIFTWVGSAITGYKGYIFLEYTKTTD